MKRTLAVGVAVLALCGCTKDQSNTPVAGDTDTGDPGIAPWDGSDIVDSGPEPDLTPRPDAEDAEIHVCTPLSVECAGPTTLRQCTLEGDEWVEAPCPSSMGCEEDECVQQVCTPYATLGVCLDEYSHERCNPAGTAYEIAVCESPAYCYMGSCIEKLCSPGKRVCKTPASIQVCNDDGTAWLDGEICPQGGICDEGQCLSPCAVNIKAGSYLGCEYWAADLDNIEDSQNAPVGLVVSVPQTAAATNVKITDNATGFVLNAAQLGLPNGNTWVQSGETKVFTLPGGHDIDGSAKTNMTFRLETTSPVAVHQFNPLNGENVHTNDASLLLPSNVTGKRYYVMSWPHRASTGFVLRGFATVIATQEGYTQVKLVPSAPVVAGQGISSLVPGTPYLFVLNQGEALNIESDGAEGEDLTGTLIEADQKVSVISGHECANVPLGIQACDHLEQQLFPVETWSNEYVGDAFSPRSAAQVDIYRVIAGGNDVVVTTTPPVPGYGEFRLQRGQWIQFASGSSFKVDADGPILVGHYLTGSAYPGAQPSPSCGGTGVDAALGDPAFTLAAPVKRYLREYAVLTPTGYIENYINVIAPNDAQIFVDGVPLTVPFVAIPGTDFSVATQLVQPKIHSVTGTKAFGLTAYGYDCDVSYAYPGGLKLQGFSGD